MFNKQGASLRKPEQRLWDTMRRNAPKEAWMQRIENNVGSGIPDVISELYTFWCWVELKAPNAPKKDTTRLLGVEGLNPDQINWHLKCAHRGGQSFILIRDSLKRLLLIDCKRMGKQIQYINSLTYNELKIYNRADSWTKIFEVLGGIS